MIVFCFILPFLVLVYDEAYFEANICASYMPELVPGFERPAAFESDQEYLQYVIDNPYFTLLPRTNYNSGIQSLMSKNQNL